MLHTLVSRESHPRGRKHTALQIMTHQSPEWKTVSETDLSRSPILKIESKQRPLSSPSMIIVTLACNFSACSPWQSYQKGEFEVVEISTTTSQQKIISPTISRRRAVHSPTQSEHHRKQTVHTRTHDLFRAHFEMRVCLSVRTVCVVVFSLPPLCCVRNTETVRSNVWS